MTPQELDKVLRQSLADRRLSFGERKALGEVLADMHSDPQQTAAIRSQVFRLAREEVDDPRWREVLEWLEDTVKVLHPVRPHETARTAVPSEGPSAGAGEQSEAFFAPHEDLAVRLVRLFDTAKTGVDICVFTITDDRVTSAVERAHRRGVRIRMITDNDKALDLGSDIERLVDAGIVVLRDETEAHMHHKFAIFDGDLLLNGSYNWTRSGSEKNNENFLLTRDPHLVAAFARHFALLWKRFT